MALAVQPNSPKPGLLLNLLISRRCDSTTSLNWAQEPVLVWQWLKAIEMRVSTIMELKQQILVFLCSRSRCKETFQSVSTCLPAWLAEQYEDKNICFLANDFISNLEKVVQDLLPFSVQTSWSHHIRWENHLVLKASNASRLSAHQLFDVCEGWTLDLKLTVLPSLTTLFSSSHCDLKLGWGLRLQKSSSVSGRVGSSCYTQTHNKKVLSIQVSCN